MNRGNMRAIAVLLLLIVAGFTTGCEKVEKATCQKLCKKGVTLTEQAVYQDISKLKEESQVEAKLFWKRKKATLNKAIDQCVERCTRVSDPYIIECMEKAADLDEYQKCLK